MYVIVAPSGRGIEGGGESAPLGFRNLADAMNNIFLKNRESIFDRTEKPFSSCDGFFESQTEDIGET